MTDTGPGEPVVLPARLHLGTNVFELPSQPPVEDLILSLSEAFAQQTSISVNVLANGNPVVIILNPALIAWIGIDAFGSWTGFHAG